MVAVPFSDVNAFVSTVAHYIHQQNKKGRPDDEYHLNLGGIGLGNGWVDASIQGGTVYVYCTCNGG